MTPQQRGETYQSMAEENSGSPNSSNTDLYEYDPAWQSQRAESLARQDYAFQLLLLELRNQEQLKREREEDDDWVHVGVLETFDFDTFLTPDHDPDMSKHEERHSGQDEIRDVIIGHDAVVGNTNLASSTSFGIQLGQTSQPVGRLTNEQAKDGEELSSTVLLSTDREHHDGHHDSGDSSNQSEAQLGVRPATHTFNADEPSNV